MSQADNLAALATNVNSSGVLGVASGGTGAATLTANNVLLGNGTSALQTVAPGTNGNLLTSNGTTWTSAAPPVGMVYPGAGIANSTGSAWGTSYSTTGSGTIVALATSPSFTTPALGTPSSGNLANCTFPTLNQNTTGSAGSVAAANITGTTLAAGVTGSSLTSVGTITSGTWSGSFGTVSGANLTSLNASNLSSGTVGTARLASGTANSTTFLRGDQTWASVSGTAKAYGFINSSSGSSVLSNSFNVSSVTLTSSGQNTINWATAFANAQYVIVATTNKGDSNNDMNAIVQTGVTGGSRQQSTTQAFLSNGYSNQFQNSQQVCFVVFSN